MFRIMPWSLRIGRIAGTDIKVHITFLLLLGFFLVAGGAAAALLLLAVFLCVLLHEFGHIAMARRFGVRTPDVILLPIGGVARLERMPEEPRQEFLIALAGPLVTLGLAVVFYVILASRGTPPALVGELFQAGSTPVDELYRINVLLLLFNLLPAFPMDGGRVLRALLAARLGLARATRIAASVGQMMAFALGFWALSQGLILLLLVAFFVFVGASGEAQAVETRMAGRGLFVRDVMVTDFKSLPFSATLNDAAELLVASEQREFPVLTFDGGVAGMLSRDDLVRGLARGGPTALARDAMAGSVALVPTDLPFERAIEVLMGSRVPALPVVENGQLVGMLTRDNVTDLVLVRRAVSSEK